MVLRYLGSRLIVTRVIGARASISPVVPFDLATAFGTMASISMTAVFGTPMDITLSELAMECFYPENEATAQMLLRERANRDG